MSAGHSLWDRALGGLRDCGVDAAKVPEKRPLWWSERRGEPSLSGCALPVCGWVHGCVVATSDQPAFQARQRTSAKASTCPSSREQWPWCPRSPGNGVSRHQRMSPSWLCREKKEGILSHPHNVSCPVTRALHTWDPFASEMHSRPFTSHMRELDSGR